MKENKLKVYAIYTDSHKDLFEEYFLPSLANTDLELHATKIKQAGLGDYNTEDYLNGILLKVQMIIQAIKENLNGVFVYSDVDIIFFKKVSHNLLSKLKDKDIVFQSDTYDKTLINTGLFICRANDKTLKLWQECEERLKKTLLLKIKKHDQNFINQILGEDPTIVKYGLLPIYQYTFLGEDIFGFKKNTLPKGAYTYHAHGVFAANVNRKKIVLSKMRDLYLNDECVSVWKYYLVVYFKIFERYINSSIFFDKKIGRIGTYLKCNYPSIYKLLKPYFPDKKPSRKIQGNNSFDPKNWKAYYINLDKRTDRRKNIELELKKQNIKVERFPALSDDDYNKCPDLKLGQNKILTLSEVFIPTDRIKGEWGCTFSHYSILKKHLDSRSDEILAIFEDDAHFCADFKERLKYLENNFDLDWDIFYLSSSIRLPHNEKTHIKHIWRIKNVVYQTHAMLINPKSILKIITLMEEYASKTTVIDLLYCHLVPRIKAYCLVPGMVSQDSSIPGNIDNRVNNTLFTIKMFGNHVFTEKLTDYDYKQTKRLIIWKNYYLGRPSYQRLLARAVKIIGSIGKKIKSISPKTYDLLKPYFPDKK